MFFYYFVFLFLFFFLLNFFSLNLIIWWSVFIMMTLSFVFMQKIQGNFSDSLNYFVLQEFMGFLFLVFNLMWLQVVILMMKVGVSPFHFWILSVFMNSDSYLLVWFLTFQKLPFIPVLLYLFKFMFYFLIFFGLLFCYFQLFSMRNFKLMLSVSSTESFNWLFLGLVLGLWGFHLMFFYYLLTMFLLINYLNLYSFMNYYLELILVFLNIPLSSSFILKIFMLSLSVHLSFFYTLVMLFLMFFSSLSFMSWFSTYSMLTQIKLGDYSTYYFFLVYVFFIIVYFFHFSKTHYITLMG